MAFIKRSGPGGGASVGRCRRSMTSLKESLVDCFVRIEMCLIPRVFELLSNAVPRWVSRESHASFKTDCCHLVMSHSCWLIEAMQYAGSERRNDVLDQYLTTRTNARNSDGGRSSDIRIAPSIQVPWCMTVVPLQEALLASIEKAPMHERNIDCREKARTRRD